MTNWIEKYQAGKKLWKKEASYKPETDTYEAKYSLPEVRVAAPNLTVAKAVREGRDKFGKDFVLPAIKAVGSLTPIGAIIGFGDAYKAWQEGNTGWAIAGAGLEALPYAGKVISKPAIKITKDVTKALKHNSPSDLLKYNKFAFKLEDIPRSIEEIKELNKIKDRIKNASTTDLIDWKKSRMLNKSVPNYDNTFQEFKKDLSKVLIDAISEGRSIPVIHGELEDAYLNFDALYPTPSMYVKKIKYPKVKVIDDIKRSNVAGAWKNRTISSGVTHNNEAISPFETGTVLNHELDHYVSFPTIEDNIAMENFLDLRKSNPYYTGKGKSDPYNIEYTPFFDKKGTEIKARLGQIKDLLGKTGNEQVTKPQLRAALKVINNQNKYNFDNNMLDTTVVDLTSDNSLTNVFNYQIPFFRRINDKDKMLQYMNEATTNPVFTAHKQGGIVPKAQKGVKIQADRRNWLQRTNDRIQTAYNKNKPQLLKDFPLLDLPGMVVEYVTGHSKDPNAGLAMVNPVGKVGTISKTIEGPIGSIPKEKIVEKISDVTFRTSKDLLSLAKRAKQHIADYIEHPIIKETAKRNTELSSRLYKRNPDIALPKNYKSSTLSPMSITNYRILNHSNPAQVSFNNKLPFNTGGRHHLDIIQHPEGPSYVGKIDINWNTHGIASAKNFSPDESKKQIMRTLEHEFGHHARIGNSRIEQLKADKLFKSHIPVIKEPINASSVIEHNKYIDYLTQPGEAAMNMRDLAGELGISIGQKYPGKEAVEHMLWKYIGGKDFIIPALKLNTKRDYKRVWDALTGKYIMVPSGIVGGSMYMNNQNKDKE